MEHWPDIAPADQATWDALAIPARISRINAYMIENWKRFRSGKPTTDVWPATDIPIIDLLAPAFGDEPGGEEVIITGHNFLNATDVKWDGVPAAAFVVDSDNQITATNPAGVGLVYVNVTTPLGTNTDGPDNQFEYFAPP